MSLAFSPYIQTNAAGSFNVSADGLVQGFAMADPSARNWLSAGVLASTETLPMWGGVAVTEDVPPAGTANPALGGALIRAATAATITGWSVFDQNYSAVNTPQSPVPLLAAGATMNFYRTGSNARLAVRCSAALVSLDGSAINSPVSWDFTNQELIPYAATYAQTTITGAVWANTAGGRTTFTVSSDLTADLDAGDIIDVTGVISTGGTGVGFNGQFTLVSITSTTIVVTQAAASSPGTYSSGGHVNAGGGAAPCRVLKIVPQNSMTVSYDTVTGFATWNRSGACALILI